MSVRLSGAEPVPAPARVDVTFTRLLDAPRTLVFKLWTDPVHMARWWGPHGFTNPVCELDVRPGGAIRIDMRAPDGTVHPMTGQFREVTPPERLVFVAVARDQKGLALLECTTTVTFEDEGGRTRLTVAADGVGLTAIGGQMLGGMEQGWTQSLERLADLTTAAQR